MRSIFIVVAMLVLMSGCGSISNTKFIPGIDHLTPIEDVDVVMHIGLAETTEECNKILWDAGHRTMVILNAIGNWGMQFGCAYIQYELETGNIFQCDVYVAWDTPYLVDHELAHCTGRADSFSW